jgi:hypothetical protein
VPCFEAGRRAGLGEQVGDARSAAPAWDGDRGTVVLPVYDHWLFTTGDSADFETLGRRLAPHPIDVADPAWRIDAAAVTGAGGAIATFMTALVPPGWVETWDEDARARGAERLGGWLAQAAALDGAAPVIGPPLYGGHAARTAEVAPGWLGELNLDARRRAAAALGAEVVRREQEPLVAEAWGQLGHVRRANRERDLVHLGTAVVARWTARHLRALAPETLVALGAPMLARVRTAPGEGPLAGTVEASALPRALVSAPLRRLATVHARATEVQRSAAVARLGARTVPIGLRPPAPAGLATVARMRAVRSGTPDEPVTPAGPVRPPVVPVTPVGPMRLPVTPVGPLRPPVVPVTPVGPLRPPVVPVTPVGPIASPVRRAAIDAGVARLQLRVPRRVEVLRPPPLALAGVAAAVAGALGDPTVLARRHGARLELGDVFTAVSPTAPLAGEPEIGHPLADLLRGLDARYLAAGVVIEPESVGLLTPNAPFIESVLIGANHELVNELRWRGAAVDGQATLLRRFFDVRGRRTAAPTDIEPIAGWPAASALGRHLRSLGQSVIVFRGEIVRRFPDPIVYAARAKIDERGQRVPRTEAEYQLDAMFRGVLTDDTMYVGFERTPHQLRTENEFGWFVILAERPSGPRFGLDESSVPPASLASWNDLSWDHVAVDRGHVYVGGRTPAAPGPIWGRDASHMAAITMQAPILFAFHANDLFAPEDG